MEEEKTEQKKTGRGISYPATVKGVDYVVYQAIWLMKKKVRKMPIEEINKYKDKYLKYIELYDAELKNRENSEAKKKQEEEEAEKQLMEELIKKYNKK